MTNVERMTVKNLAFCLRGHLHTLIFTESDRAELADYARLQLANIGVEAAHMDYTELLTTCEVMCGERTVAAA